jgi:hypothetical protein
MVRALDAQPVMTPWSRSMSDAYGEAIVRFNHRLAETGLFSDAALAALIDRHSAAQTDICTMKRNPPPGETWIAGEARGMKGADLVRAVKKGDLWVSCRGAMASDPEYRPVFDEMIAAFGKAIGMPILSANASVLISGPRMGIFFHCDPTETMLWHVRGTKTINLYPRTDDYIPEQRMEAILLKENLADAPWRDEMAAGATPVALKPGDAVCWPLHGPHNVINGPDMNVSVSVEYATPASAMTNGVLYVNGVLRRTLGLDLSYAGTPAPLRPVYWAAAKALRTFAPPKHNAERAHVRQFDVDLGAPGCIRWREGFGPAKARTKKAA